MRKASAQGLKIVMLGLLMSSMAFTHAQTRKGAIEAGIEAGPFLLVASGGGETIGGFGLCLEPHLDYFLTDDFAVGGTTFFYGSFDNTEEGFSFGAAYGHINYFFSSSSRISPYIGIRVGVLNPNSELFFGAGPQIGLKYFPAHQFSINLQLDGAIHGMSGGTVFLADLVLGLSFHI
jgi:hypothetical protein